MRSDKRSTRQRPTRSRGALGPFGLAALIGLGACHEAAEPQTPADESDPCGPEAKIELAGETAGAAIVTGGTTAWEGTKTFGKSVAGFVRGGADEAADEWDEGAEQTRKTARKGADETRSKARAKPCPAD